jgi:hypothetical protein
MPRNCIPMRYTPSWVMVEKVKLVTQCADLAKASQTALRSAFTCTKIGIAEK